MSAAYAALAALIVLALDRWSKAVVASRLADPELSRMRWGIGIRPIKNARGSMLGVRLPVSLALSLACVLALGLLFAAAAHVPPLLAASIGVVIGGASSNLLDRLHGGAVIDFIVLGPWPTFNLADAAMVLGCATIAWVVL
jgi:signal peptidase II